MPQKKTVERNKAAHDEDEEVDHDEEVNHEGDKYQEVDETEDVIEVQIHGQMGIVCNACDEHHLICLYYLC